MIPGIAGALGQVLSVVKDVEHLGKKAEELGDAIKEHAKELRDHENRLIKLETKWDVAMQISTSIRNQSFPQIDNKS